jgi:hypothetical protein
MIFGKGLKTYKGRHTERNVWDDAARLSIVRGGMILDPGVNYFVLMLNQLGFPTIASCEGHHRGCYVVFQATYNEALRINSASQGWLGVEIAAEDSWALRQPFVPGEKERVDGLRWAADAWGENLGPLDFDKITLSDDVT